MIPIFEDYLGQMIADKITYLKNNLNAIDRIVSTNIPRPDRLKNYLANTPVKVIKGYPRTQAEMPCICILLSNEEEIPEGLGDFGEEDDIDIIEHTETLTVTNEIEGAAKYSIPHVNLSHFPVVATISASSAGESLDVEEYEVLNYDRGLLGLFNGMSNGEQVTVRYTYRRTSSVDISVMYESNYRIEVWAANADLTVDLYHLVKWAFLYSRDYLGKDLNLLQQKLGGSDFEPAPNWFPDFAYRRGLTFWCKYSISVPVEEIPYISDVAVNETITFDSE